MNQTGKNGPEAPRGDGRASQTRRRILTTERRLEVGICAAFALPVERASESRRPYRICERAILPGSDRHSAAKLRDGSAQLFGPRLSQRDRRCEHWKDFSF